MSGPLPRYQPQFTPEEIAQAREILGQHTAPYMKVVRAKMVVILSEEPSISNRVLADQVKVHYNTACKWRKRWTQGGFTLEDQPRSGRPAAFSLVQIAQVKAVACQLPAERNLPLSRFSLKELKVEVESCELITSISTGTIWRILHEDAIRPWYHQSWIFPKDPDFVEKAGPILDLYQRQWEGKPLEPKDYILSADEKSQLQILFRETPVLSPDSHRPIRVEYEYERMGTVAYIAAMDVASGKVFGIVDESTGILPFNRLVDLVMQQEPYASGNRVFWLVDNGSSHYTTTFPTRLKQAYPNAIAVHLPIHASWLNQIEIYFSILQRKALTPNDLGDRYALEERLLGFQERYNRTAQPFRWRFTRQELERRLVQLKLAA